jgi:hypothetical protein
MSNSSFYRVVSGEGSFPEPYDSFIEECNQLIAEGYVPHGSLVVTVYGVDHYSVLFHQAFILKSPNTIVE